jgi:hypothetical protein
MKRLIIITVALLIVIGFFSNSYARRGRNYYKTYEIVDFRVDGIVLQDFEGTRFLVDKDKQGYKIGDQVRYDNVRNRLKKSPWQPGTVTKVTNRVISLRLSDGNKVDVNMKSSWQGQFKKGDTVSYNVSNGKLKRSNTMQIVE